MVTVRFRSKFKTKLKIDCFTNKVGKNFQYFVRVFNKTIIPLAPVGCEMIIANSTLSAKINPQKIPRRISEPQKFPESADITRKNPDLNKSTTQKILAKFSRPN